MAVNLFRIVWAMRRLVAARRAGRARTMFVTRAICFGPIAVAQIWRDGLAGTASEQEIGGDIYPIF